MGVQAPLISYLDNWCPCILLRPNIIIVSYTGTKAIISKQQTKPVSCLKASNGSSCSRNKNQTPDKGFQSLAVSGPYYLPSCLTLPRWYESSIALVSWPNTGPLHMLFQIFATFFFLVSSALVYEALFFTAQLKHYFLKKAFPDLTPKLG